MMRLLRFFRRMNVLLFLSFLLFSFTFIALIVSVDNLNWNMLFQSFQSKDLDKTAYLIMDDMRQNGIGPGPLTLDEQNWLKRRAALYGILLRYESKDRKTVWLDTFEKADRQVGDDAIVDADYVSGGAEAGTVHVSYMSQRNELDPAYQEVQGTIRLRTRGVLATIMVAAILFSLLIARRLSKNLHQVDTMAVEISAGKRDIRIPVRGPEEVRRLATTLNDMTAELKRQEDWRHHLMEDFMHELRTPLTSILSQVEAIVDGLYEPDTDRLDGIYDELVRLSRLVNDLERLSEAEAARFTMNVRRTNMVELGRRIHNNFKALAREKRIRFLYDPTNVPCYAEVDRDKMIQVLSNIVLNAIKYTSGGGIITLRVDWADEYTVLSCEDTGIGISQQDLPYIFNRLYRADKSRSRFSGGVGLGLSIVKALVEAHRGEITAESQVGKGSKFMITIPSVYRAYGEKE